MQLTFSKQKMLLNSVNARAEIHGDEREPAGDISLLAQLPNDVLNVFHPTLKGLLYHFDKGRERDLADQGRAHEAGFAPDLRLPKLGLPLKWADEIANAKVTIRVPGETKEVVLQPVKVNDFKLTPIDGGTVEFHMRVQYHPEERQAGKLAMLVQQEVEVSLEQVAEVPETE